MNSPLLELKNMPALQNRVYFTAEEARNCAVGNMRLVRDGQTGLVHNEIFDQNLPSYDELYDNEQSLSETFKSHLLHVQDLITTRLGRRDLYEIGCGKGYFLEQLRYSGCDIHGCDPTFNGTSEFVTKSFFNSKLGVRKKNLILRHVLEHIPSPLSFLEEIAESNNGGLIYIEVPSLEWILDSRSWYDIFYEHANYFSQESLFGSFGRIIDSGEIFGRQYLYVIGDLATLKSPKCKVELTSFENFSPNMKEVVDRLKGRQVAIWGAASKGVIFAKKYIEEGGTLDFAIDVNPQKQNRFLACSGLIVLSPEMALDRLSSSALILVSNSNYLNEIKKATQHRFTYVLLEGLNA